MTYIVNNPQFVPIAINAVSGYVLLATLYRDSSVWPRFDNLERWILGGLIGICFGSLIVWPLVDALFYTIWKSETNSGFASAVIFGGVALCLLLSRLSQDFDEVTLVRSLRRLVISIAVISICVALGSFIISIQVRSYQAEVVPIISPYWSYWPNIAALLLLSALVVIPFEETFLTRKGQRSGKRIASIRTVKEARIRSAFLKWPPPRTVLSGIGLLLIIVVASNVMVIVDTNSALFTPRVSREQTKLYPAEDCQTLDYGRSGWNVVVRDISDSYTSYRVTESSFSIQVPHLRGLVNDLYIPNPSNSSFVYAQGPALTGQGEWQW